MDNRYLFVGDPYCGTEGAAGQLLAGLLLSEFPQRPLQFHVHCSFRNTLQSLLKNCPRDLIGKQAGTIVLCVGYQDLCSGLPVQELIGQYRNLLHEIRSNSPASLLITTLYAPENADASAFNHAVSQDPGSALLLDFSAVCTRYQKLQEQRGEHQRNLLDTESRLTHLGEMLLARFLACKLAPVIPHPEWDRNTGMN